MPPKDSPGYVGRFQEHRGPDCVFKCSMFLNIARKCFKLLLKNKEGPEKTNKLLLNLILQHMGPTGLNLQTTILTNQPVRNHCPGERFMAGAPLAPSS